MAQIKHMLLAFDGSPGAAEAARFAGEIARAMSPKVTVLMVHDDDQLLLEPFPAAFLPEAVPYSPLPIDEYKAAAERRAVAEALPGAREALGEVPGEVVFEQTWGHISTAICDFAAEHDVDLVIIGSRGRSAVARMLLGSVSAQVVAHSPCPVTVVHW